jgi:hypothetical protein
MCLDIIDDVVFDGPFEEIELANRGFHEIFFVIGDGNTLPATKRVESALGICFEFELVIIVDLESFYSG